MSLRQTTPINFTITKQATKSKQNNSITFKLVPIQGIIVLRHQKTVDSITYGWKTTSATTIKELQNKVIENALLQLYNYSYGIYFIYYINLSYKHISMI